MVRLGQSAIPGLVFTLTAVSFLCADQITLTNGDHISGKVVSYENNILHIQTPMLGQLKIKVADIKILNIDKELPIVLQSDPHLQPYHITADEQGLHITSGNESQTIEWQAVKAIGKAAEKLNQPPAPPKLPDKSYKFSGNISAGFSGYQGNVNMDILTSNVVLKLANPDWAYKAYFNSYYGQLTTNGDRTPFADMVNTGGSVRRELGKKCSATLSLDQNRNDFLKLKFRNSTTGILGFQWLNDKHFKYETFFGAGHEYEEITEKRKITRTDDQGNQQTKLIDDLKKQNAGIGSLTSDLVFKVNDHVDLSQKTTWIPRIDDETDYRIVADSAATIYLDKAKKLFLKTGIRHEYDTTPSYKVEELDIYYFSNVGFNF